MKYFAMMLIASSLMVLLPSRVCAESTYPYLTFVTNSGETTVSESSLKMTISGSTLSVDHTEGNTTFDLANLIKMYFSSSSTGINSMEIVGDEEIEVFSVDGVSLGRFADKTTAVENLKKGVYVLKTKRETMKVAVQ